MEQQTVMEDCDGCLYRRRDFPWRHQGGLHPFLVVARHSYRRDLADRGCSRECGSERHFYGDVWWAAAHLFLSDAKITSVDVAVRLLIALMGADLGFSTPYDDLII